MGALHEKLRLDLHFVYRKSVGRSNLWIFIHFYYWQIMRTFSRSFCCFLIHIQTIFLTMIMSRIWKLFIQSHSKIIQSTQSKCCKTKITSCKHATFLKNGSPHSNLNIFAPNVVNKRNLPEIQNRHFMSSF